MEKCKSIYTKDKRTSPPISSIFPKSRLASKVNRAICCVFFTPFIILHNKNKQSYHIIS